MTKNKINSQLLMIALLQSTMWFQPALADVVPGMPAPTAATVDSNELSDSQCLWILEMSSSVTECLASMPDDEHGKKSPWFAKLQQWALAAKEVAETRKRDSLLALIPSMAEFFDASMKDQDMRESFSEARGHLESCGSTIIEAMALQIQDCRGDVSDAQLANFIRVYATRGFVLEPDWEERRPPIDRAGLVILQRDKVVAQVKAMPLENAEYFVGNWTAAIAFERYAADGHGMPLLKERYAGNKAQFEAKWQELFDWVKQQRAQARASQQQSE